MMKSKLLIVMSVLFVLSFDGLALAEKTNDSNAGAAFSPDGIAVTNPQRRRKRRRRYKAPRPEPIPMITPPNTGAAPPEPAPAPPPPPPAPAQEEMPTMSAPPSDPMDAPGRGRPAKKAGPSRIKPPTVNIKPPTE